MPDQWTIPTQQEVEGALVSIADLSLRSLFFSELENPEWLEPLAAMGVFSNPPAPQIDSQGHERVLPWPEGDYLIRVAPERPATVAALLKSVAGSKNPWVHRVLITAASKLPAHEARELVRPIADVVATSPGLLNVNEVMGIIASLSEDGDTASVKKLLSAMFEPLRGPQEETGFGTFARVRGSIDDYYYTDLLPRSVPILIALGGLDGLRLTAGWLEKASKIMSGGRPGRGGSDSSNLWRPSVAPHAQNSGLHEITDTLIDTVRDISIGLGRAGQPAEVVEYLNGLKLFILRRIALEVAAQLLSDEVSQTELVHVGYRFLMDPTVMGIGSRPEYVRLTVAVLPRLSEAQRNSWAEYVLAGKWEGSDDDMRRIAARGERKTDDVSEQEIADVREYFLHKFLQPLVVALPRELADVRAALEDKRGKIEHGEFGSYIESFTGPTSPKTRDELLAMSADELATYLADWEPPSDWHFGPSVEGLARQLELVAEAAPKLVAEISDRLVDAGRSYVRASLSGWAKAVPSGYVPSDAVWDMVRVVVSKSDQGGDEAEEHEFEDDDPVWRWAQRSAVDLIAATTTSMPSPPSPEQISQLWGLLEPLTNHPDPTAEHESKYGGSNMDPLTLSLNTTRPAALRAAIHLAAASHGNDRKPGNPNSSEAEILRALANHLDDDADPSLATAAVIGEGIGRIWGVDPMWVDTRRDLLFSLLDDDAARRARSDVIVSVALRTYRPGSVFTEMIRPALELMFTPTYAELDHIEGWRERRSAADAAALHVISAYLVKVIERSDPLIAQVFSTEAPTELAAEAVGHVGWQIMRTVMDGGGHDIAADYLARATALIDWRVDEIREGRASAKELAQFFWWARADKFSPSWWLPILSMASREAEQDSRSSGMLGEPLANAAAAEPALAIQVFEELYRADDPGWRSYDLVQHAPRILAAAILSGDEDAQAGAARIKDVLGRQGHFGALQDLEQLLATIRESDAPP